MHTAIIYYDHDKFAVLYYNESDGNWEVILDEIFRNATAYDLYDDIMSEFYQFLYEFNRCIEIDEGFDFSEFIHYSSDDDFYLVEVK